MIQPYSDYQPATNVNLAAGAFQDNRQSYLDDNLSSVGSVAAPNRIPLRTQNPHDSMVSSYNDPRYMSQHRQNNSVDQYNNRISGPISPASTGNYDHRMSNNMGGNPTIVMHHDGGPMAGNSTGARSDTSYPHEKMDPDARKSP